MPLLQMPLVHWQSAVQAEQLAMPVASWLHWPQTVVLKVPPHPQAPVGTDGTPLQLPLQS